MASPDTREAAQLRIDQIEVFERELAQIQADGALQLTASQAAAVTAYHRHVTQELTARYDADASDESRHLSLSMRIVSFIGACSVGASVFLLFYHFWGDFNLTAQTSFLCAAPLATVALALFVRSRDASGYFVQLSAALGYSCCVLAVVVLPSLWNFDPGAARVLVCGVVALILAYVMRSRLLLCAALIGALVYSAAVIAQLHGALWWEFAERPENFLLAAAVLLAVPAIVTQRRDGDFAMLYRLLGGFALFTALLVLGGWPSLSYLAYEPVVVAGGYQVAAAAASIGSIYLGVRLGLAEMSVLGSFALLVLLVQKIGGWLLPLVPPYEFFLVVSALAVAGLYLLKRVRVRVRARAAIPSRSARNA